MKKLTEKVKMKTAEGQKKEDNDPQKTKVKNNIIKSFEALNMVVEFTDTEVKVTPKSKSSKNKPLIFSKKAFPGL